ncbi:triphosphoribosyl-dephospho-CoA synthase [Caldimonas sp. KR1-144]|uniref:triphosphoribosyl-dephospho-CoA synthase n=1 Tax=Caldimonas sp. KR1-144 TaxID=3400911 RepID=UPI003C0BC097
MRERIAAAFELACTLDVAVRKPGNVSLVSPGHGMRAQQFVDSAHAARDAITLDGASVGERIEVGVWATQAVAGCNTNLGILLLAAPIAMAAEVGRDLRTALAAVFAALTLDDAERTFRAITVANPGGLGHSSEADVRAPATMTLRQAMQLAAHRDRIARQYAEGGAELFDLGLAAWDRHGRWDDPAPGVQAVYLAWLSSEADSHIVRRQGAPAAQAVTAEAAVWARRAEAGEHLDADPAFAAWDQSLKRQGLNPGTSADLTVATLMLAALLDDRAFAGMERDN